MGVSVGAGLPALHMKPRNSKANSSKSVQRHARQSQAGSAVHIPASDSADADKRHKVEPKVQHIPCRHDSQKPFVCSADAHLAALKALGKQDAVLCTNQSSNSLSNKEGNRKGVDRHAAMHHKQPQQPQKKKAIDMFGVAVDDSMQGTSPGLVILRLASSLW